MTPVRVSEIEPPPTPLDDQPDVVWMSPDISIYGWGEALRIAAGFGPDRFGTAEAAFHDWAESMRTDSERDAPGPMALASFTFDDRSAGSVLVVPAVAIVRRDDRWFRIEIGSARLTDVARRSRRPDVRPTDRPRYAGASIPDVQWLEAVADAIDMIEAREIDKVVLARDHALWSKVAFDPGRLLARLHSRFPECFVFHVDGLVGASPELLVRRSGLDVASRALAGSAARHDDPAVDGQLGRSLLASDKDRREHESAADSVDAVLRPLCDCLEREAEPSLLLLANVQHLATWFRGRLRDPISTIALAARLHPTAAVGGTPVDRAVDVIRDLEQMDRGRYAGPVGWMDTTGDGEFAIALRCAEISGARARLFAGAGIVAGSLPESELEETRLKLLAMQSAFE